MSDLEMHALAAIKAGNDTNRAIRVALGLSPNVYHHGVDAALVALRKRGEIRYGDGRWVSCDLTVCPTCGGKGKVPK